MHYILIGLSLLLANATATSSLPGASTFVAPPGFPTSAFLYALPPSWLLAEEFG